MNDSLQALKYVMIRGIIVPVSLGVGIVTLGVGIFKWWRKKI